MRPIKKHRSLINQAVASSLGKDNAQGYASSMEGHPVPGWVLVERQLQLVRQELSAARHSPQFQAIGVHCREILISLAKAIYVVDRHRPLLGPEPGPADFKGKLEAYVAVELRGQATKEDRKHAQAVIELAFSAYDLANKVQHNRSADSSGAARCVTATASVVDFIRITAGRADVQHTVGELLERYVKERSPGRSGHYTLLRIARSPIGNKLASALQPKDVIEICQQRKDAGINPATITQDVSYLKNALFTARDEWKLNVAADAVEKAKPVLEKAGVLAQAIPRRRRPNREALARLMNHFRQREADPRTEIPMADIIEFALWSARKIGEICSLRWTDLDDKERTCIVRGIRQARKKKGRDHRFKLLGKAWDIVQRQPRTGELIFPYNAQSASACYTRATKKLGISDLWFNDLRLEAARRLHESGYAFEEVADVIGLLHLDPLYRELRGSLADGPRSEAQEGAGR